MAPDARPLDRSDEPASLERTEPATYPTAARAGVLLSRIGFRAAIAIASLVSGSVALYLHLWKRSYLAQLATAASEGTFESLRCGVGGGCLLAQTSAYSWFLGVDVALIGTIGYGGIVAASLLGLIPRWQNALWPTYALLGLIYPAVLFTIRLKYGEFFVLRTFCSWCAVSAVTITLCAILITLDHRRLTRAAAGGSAE